MLKVEFTLTEVDYDRIFTAYFPKIQPALADSDDATVATLARLPASAAGMMWKMLPTGQKEKIAARLLSAKAEEFIPEAERALREKDVALRIGDVRITTK